MSTTCICAMFTKMEMVECSEIERAAGKVGYKKKNVALAVTGDGGSFWLGFYGLRYFDL